MLKLIKHAFEDFQRWRERLHWKGLLADVELALLLGGAKLPPESRLALVERATQLKEKLVLFDAETLKIEKSRREREVKK